MKIVIGAGGGYDILVASMIRNRLLRQGNGEIEVGGFLNPKFLHFFSRDRFVKDIATEKAVNAVVAVVRFRRMNVSTDRGKSDLYAYYCKHGIQKDIVDGRLANLLDCNVFDFSLQYDMDTIVSFLVKRYEEITLCDVGGDILFSGYEDRMVTTPIIDAYALEVVTRYMEKSSQRATLVLLGLGIDGELPAENITRNMNRLHSTGAVKSTENIEAEDIRYLEEVYRRVRTDSGGKTNQLLIDIWRNNLTGNDVALARKISSMEEWFNRIYTLDLLTTKSLNPLCQAKDYDEMLALAKRYGVSIARYRSDPDIHHQ